MKLFRFGSLENEKPGVFINGKKLDISLFGEDYNEVFFTTNGVQRLEEWLAENVENLPEIPDNERLAPCVARPSKIVCIGLNYTKHAAESGMATPQEPVVFFKSTTALCGPNDALIIPKNSIKTDWEVELAVVIGKKASYIERKDALNYVVGYCVHNDYSEREFQLEKGGQWVKGKSNDTFAPIGPYLVTSDEIPNPQNLNLWLKVNGKKLQDSNTNDMIFDVKHIVSYLSNFMTLLPGDIISTGTPSGVGLGFKPPIFLKPNDVVELGIEKLGTQRQVAQAYSS